MNEEAPEPAAPEVVTDALLDGRLVLRQPRRGHRAGTDAVLLAAACTARPGDVLVDVGCGVGTVGLAVALREPGVTGFLLDDDPLVSGLARENCRVNRVESRIAVVTADLFDAAARRGAGLPDGRADVVVTNPPFFDAATTRPSTDAAKARAHVLGAASEPHGHADWLRAATALLAPKGCLYAIHRPEALPELLQGCEGRLGAVVLMPVHAKPDGPAIRVLISGVKGSRAPLKMLLPLVLHRSDGTFTAEAEALHRGEGVLSLDTPRRSPGQVFG